MEKIQGFPPIADEYATVLILGSMPSVISLERREFYGNPYNHFWRLLFAALGCECPAVYQEKTARAIARGIAIHDVLHACLRKGSLDKDIKNEEPNDIASFVVSHNRLRAIAFNGAMARKMYDKYFPRYAHLAYVVLPSSSPVPRRHIKTYEDKLPLWLALRRYIDG
jgi:TDG/mug DNA glycosylase family protein